MAHERIKEIAAKVYGELEIKAVIDLLLPARRLVLNHVEYLHGGGTRKPGSIYGCHSCDLEDDVCLSGDNTPETVFRQFYRMEECWTVRQVAQGGDEHDCIIHLEAAQDGNYLKINLCNYECSELTKYIIDSVMFKNAAGAEFFIMQNGADPLTFSLEGCGENEKMVILGGKAAAETLIDEAAAMVRQLTLRLDKHFPSGSITMLGLPAAIYFRVLDILGSRIDRLIRCYNAGLLSRLPKIGAASLREIEEKLIAFGVQKVPQQSRGKGVLYCEEIQELMPESPEDNK